jgi:ABC-type microcin C transport system duplicated ATPase subunit YejF
MTLTAMQPDRGLQNGRETFSCKDSQALTSISALRVVFSDLYGSLAPRK